MGAVTDSPGVMYYQPGISYQGGQLRAAGMMQGFQDLAAGAREYYQNKSLGDATQGQIEGIMGANPDLYQTAQNDPNMGPLMTKLQKGNATLPDMQRIHSYLSTMQAQKMMKLQQSMLANQATQSDLATQAAKQRQQNIATINANADQQLAAAKNLMGATTPATPAPSGPMAMMNLPQGATANFSGMGTPQPQPDMGGGGVLTPMAQKSALDFMSSPTGQMRRMGVTLTPEMLQNMMDMQLKYGWHDRNFQPSLMTLPNGQQMIQDSPRQWRPVTSTLPKPNVNTMPVQPVTIAGKDYFFHPASKRFFDAKGNPVSWPSGNMPNLGGDGGDTDPTAGNGGQAMDLGTLLNGAGPKAGAPAAAAPAIALPKSKADRDALPKGTRYKGPDGKIYIKS